MVFLRRSCNQLFREILTSACHFRETANFSTRLPFSEKGYFRLWRSRPLEHWVVAAHLHKMLIHLLQRASYSLINEWYDVQHSAEDSCTDTMWVELFE